MNTQNKSTLFIYNGYCCGHGKIVNLLENWCIRNKVDYSLVHVTTDSKAVYGDKEIILSPTLQLDQVVSQLGLSQSTRKQ